MSNYTASYNIILQDNFSKTLKSIESSVKGFEGKLSGLTNKVGGNGNGGLGGGFSGLMGIASRALVVLGGFQAVKGIVKLGADMENTKVTFSTFLGSAEKANEVIKDLQAFGAATPFEFDDLKKSATLLLNFGVSAQQLIPTLNTLGDLSAGNAQKLDSITLAYGKIKTKGKASMEELNMLIEGGQIPIMQELEKVTGCSII